MKRISLRLLAVAMLMIPALRAQGVVVRAAPFANPPADSGAASIPPVPLTWAPMSAVQHTDVVFPHVAAGGGWETLVVLVNLGSNTITFHQYFYDESGNPMLIKFHTIPEDQVVETAVIEWTLPPSTNGKITLFEDTPSAQVGWSQLDYDSALNRIGGYACFRLMTRGVVNEGMVPLSAYDDTSFMMPFDNSQGISTGLAFANPGTGVTAQVQIVALDEEAVEITRGTVGILPSAHLSYVLADQMPALAGQRGTLVVTSNTTRLSAVGIRMNMTGGLTFTSIPILRWAPGT